MGVPASVAVCLLAAAGVARADNACNCGAGCACIDGYTFNYHKYLNHFQPAATATTAQGCADLCSTFVDNGVGLCNGNNDNGQTDCGSYGNDGTGYPCNTWYFDSTACYAMYSAAPDGSDLTLYPQANIDGYTTGKTGPAGMVTGVNNRVGLGQAGGGTARTSLWGPKFNAAPSGSTSTSVISGGGPGKVGSACNQGTYTGNYPDTITAGLATCQSHSNIDGVSPIYCPNGDINFSGHDGDQDLINYVSCCVPTCGVCTTNADCCDGSDTACLPAPSDASIKICTCSADDCPHPSSNTALPPGTVAKNPPQCIISPAGVVGRCDCPAGPGNGAIFSTGVAGGGGSQYPPLETPGLANGLYTIQSVGTAAENPSCGSYLAAPACGATGSVLSQSNAAGNAIVWSLTQVHDNVYNIRNVAREQCTNGPPTYLSCASCNFNLVDMYYEDDKSGRQQWQLQATGTSSTSGNYEVVVSAGRDGCNIYLSTTTCPGGPLIDLYTTNDNSNRQLWHFTPVAATQNVLSISGKNATKPAVSVQQHEG